MGLRGGGGGVDQQLASNITAVSTYLDSYQLQVLNDNQGRCRRDQGCEVVKYSTGNIQLLC